MLLRQGLAFRSELLNSAVSLCQQRLLTVPVLLRPLKLPGQRLSLAT